MPKYEKDGCGPWWFPSWLRCGYFEKECNQHDADYMNGHDKIKADMRFLTSMLIKARQSKARTMQAYVFYFMVLWFGGISYKEYNK